MKRFKEYIKEELTGEYEFRDPWGYINLGGKIIDGSKKEWSRDDIRKGRHHALARLLGQGDMYKAIKSGYIRWFYEYGPKRDEATFEFSLERNSEKILQNLESFIATKQNELIKMDEFVLEFRYIKNGKEEVDLKRCSNLKQLKQNIESLKTLQEAFDLDYRYRNLPWGLISPDGKIIDGSKKEWTKEQLESRGRHNALATYLGLGGIDSAVDQGYIRWGYALDLNNAFFEFSLGDDKETVLSNLEMFLSAKQSDLSKIKDFYLDVHVSDIRHNSFDDNFHNLWQVRHFIEELRNKNLDTSASI